MTWQFSSSILWIPCNSDKLTALAPPIQRANRANDQMADWPLSFSHSFWTDLVSIFAVRRSFLPAASVFGNRSGARRLFQNVFLIPLISRSTTTRLRKICGQKLRCGSSHRVLVRTCSSRRFEWEDGEGSVKNWRKYCGKGCVKSPLLVFVVRDHTTLVRNNMYWKYYCS